MDETPQHWGKALKQQRLDLARDVKLSGGERRLAMREPVLARLRELFGEVAVEHEVPPTGWALACVGGIARGDSGPASDVDLVLLHDGKLGSAVVSEIADALWYPLWDAGLKLDHSVRTPDECRQISRDDLSAAIALLDLSAIAGDSAFVERTRGSLLGDWRSGIRKRTAAIEDSAQERANRFGDLAHLLEPDLKEAHGGLRDVVLINALTISWLVDRPHYGLDDAYGQLLDIRDALQVMTGRTTEKLILPEQDAVAGFCDTDADGLLAQVADAARTIAHSLESTLRRARQAGPSRKLFTSTRRPELKALANGIFEHEAEVVLGANVSVAADPVVGLRVAATAAQSGLPISPTTTANIAANAPELPVPWPAEAREAFVDLLSGDAGLVTVWEALDRQGLITRWLPEWEGIRNRPQRNAIHRHTVDRHSIEAVVCVKPLLRYVNRPDLLLMATLLHDIGKIAGSRDHSRDGAPIAESVMRRMGWPESDVQVVKRLVAEHLTLMDLATRRDPDDPQTVTDLATAVDDRCDILDLLRALSEADARSVGQAAWSTWRARLADDLTNRAQEALAGNVPDGPAPLGEDEQQLVQRVTADGDARVLVQEFSGLHAITIVAPDRPGLIADIAGVLAVERLSVKSALIRTLDGIAVDTWWVDQTHGSAPEAAHLETQLRRILDGDSSAIEVLARRDAGYRPRRGVEVRPRVLLLPGASSEVTVLEVRAPDRPGLLHALGTALVEQDVSVRSAHIATHAGQAVDVLYVTHEGAPLKAAKVAQVVFTLMEAATLPGRPVE